jgi:hypothetical protein
MGASNRHRVRPNREDPPRKSSVQAPPGPPPTLAELSARNVAELLVWCGAWPQRCFHCGIVSLAALDPTQTIAEVTPRLVCTKCGLVGGYAQPRWP